MVRIARWLSLVSLLFVAAASSVTAQAPSTNGAQTVSNRIGYQFQVPLGWLQLPSSLDQRLGSVLIQVDSEMVSADGLQHAHVETVTGAGITPPRLADALASYLGLGQGGDAPGTAPLTSLGGPTAVQVANAEAAMSGSAVYSDPSGTQRVVTARAAVRGDTTYLLAMDVTQDFFQSDPSVAAIMSSFQLTAP